MPPYCPGTSSLCTLESKSDIQEEKLDKGARAAALSLAPSVTLFPCESTRTGSDEGGGGAHKHVKKTFGMRTLKALLLSL